MIKSSQSLPSEGFAVGCLPMFYFIVLKCCISYNIWCFYSRLNTRPVFGGIRSRIGIQQTFLGRPASSVGFQRTFDARQKIGVTDARQKIGVKDAREKLLQKDARFKIKGKVQDARETLNSRKQQSVEKVTKVVDAREKISLKRSVPAATIMNAAMETVAPTVKITKTIQVGYGCQLLEMWLHVFQREHMGKAV